MVLLLRDDRLEGGFREAAFTGTPEAAHGAGRNRGTNI